MSQAPLSGRRVVIVGGGVVGLCAAYYALERGHAVTLLERGAPDHDGCSLGNAGMVVPSHFIPLAAPGMVGLGLRMMLRQDSPFAVRLRPDADLLRWGWRFWRAANVRHVQRSAPLLRDLNLTSRRLYEELAGRIGDFGLVQRGLLMLCKTPEALREEAHVAEQARALGLAADVLTPQLAAQVDPDIRMDVAGAVHFAQDCHLDPRRLMAALTAAVQRRGADIRWCTQVAGWRTEGGRIAAARTASGEVEGDAFVVAGGAWSPGLIRPLGLRLPMQAGKGYSLTLARPRSLPRLCSILTEARVAVTPMGKELRFAGTMEVTGLDRSISQPRVEGILRSIPRYFPELRAEDFHGVPVWSGLRPCSPDGLPYVGRFARWPNLLAATGHAMMGVSLAPVTGSLVASLLSDEPPAFDIAALSPDRFG